MSLNLVFAGTPDFAAQQLAALIANQHNIIGVYTQPDRPAKRGKKIQASPVKDLALKHDLCVYQPVNFKSQSSIDELANLKPDLMIVVAYGLFLPQAVLDIPRYGCINVHASLLPRWRGAAPIQRAIEAGDTQTGITIMQMDKGLDTGDMLAKASVSISPCDNGESLHNKLALAAPELLLNTMDAIEHASHTSEPQDNELATYAHKLNKQEALIDWHHNADTLMLKIRAFNPFPMCYCFIKNKRLRILKAQIREQHNHSQTPSTITSLNDGIIWVATKKGELGLQEIQLEGKRAMSAQELINGQPDLFTVGTRLVNT